MTDFAGKLLSFLALIIAIMLHEIAHGVAALMMGDDTAKRQGRLSLNPIRHIDIIGTIVLPMMLFLMNTGVLFGWAKPVPINLGNMRNPRKGMWVTALVGPLTNLVLAVIGAGLYIGFFWLHVRWFGYGSTTPVAISLIEGFFLSFMVINIVLMLFNLMPIPPLDGSKVLAAFLPGETARSYLALQPFGFLVIFIFLQIGFFQDVLTPVLKPVLRWVSSLRVMILDGLI